MRWPFHLLFETCGIEAADASLVIADWPVTAITAKARSRVSRDECNEDVAGYQRPTAPDY